MSLSVSVVTISFLIGKKNCIPKPTCVLLEYARRPLKAACFNGALAEVEARSADDDILKAEAIVTV